MTNYKTKSVKLLIVVVETLERKIKSLEELVENILTSKAKELEERESKSEAKINNLIEQVERQTDENNDNQREKLSCNKNEEKQSRNIIKPSPSSWSLQGHANAETSPAIPVANTVSPSPRAEGHEKVVSVGAQKKRVRRGKKINKNDKIENKYIWTIYHNNIRGYSSKCVSLKKNL